MAIYIYRVTYDRNHLGTPDAALGDSPNVVDWDAYFRTKSAANAFVRECAKAWQDNRPGPMSDDETAEWDATDFSRYYDIERLSVADAVQDMGEDYEIEVLRIAAGIRA